MADVLHVICLMIFFCVQLSTEYLIFWLCNVTFNNIIVISWLSAVLVEETGIHVVNNGPAEGQRQTLSHKVVSRTPNR